MKTKWKFAKITPLALLLATLAVYTVSGAEPTIANAAHPSTVQTQGAPTTDFVFGLIGLGRAQTARINLAFVANGPDDRSEPVEVEFMFQDREGNVLASERQRLLPGHAGSFDTHGIIAINQERLSLIANVAIIGVLAPETRNRIVPTLEVFDDPTGKTQFALNNPHAIIAIL
jgi:hypothetical protein